MRKGEIACYKQFLIFSVFSTLYGTYTPVEDGTYYVNTRGGRVASPILCPEHISQDYASYGYETSWVDRSHQGRVHCTGTVTLACIIFELLPFVYFHTWILSGAYLQNYTSYGYEILWVDRSYQGGVQCTGTITLACLIFELLPFVYFHTWILSGAYLQNYTSYGYEILWVDRSHQGGVQCTWTITLVCFFFLVIALCLFSYLTFVRRISPKLYQLWLWNFMGG